MFQQREELEKGKGADVLPFSIFTVKSVSGKSFPSARIMFSEIIAHFSQVNAKLYLPSMT